MSNIPDLSTELQFQASRSSGAGGQHVNKVSTKIELRFSVEKSELLSPEQKQVIQEKLANRITREGDLLLVCQNSRSQLKNKEFCIKKLYRLLQEALQPEKLRKATKPSRQSVRKRLESKKKQSEKKSNRGPVNW